MLFSYKKIIQMLGVEKSENEIINAINSIGFEVDDSYKTSDISGVKFGCIKSIKQNPNSKQLLICEILFDDKMRSIQTTAQNVEKDKYIIAFINGSRMNDIFFKEKELAGISSDGMLAGYTELGFNNYKTEDGIMLFDNIDVSKDPIDELHLNDFIIDVDILTNRSDAASYQIMVNEIAAYFDIKWDILNMVDNKEKVIEVSDVNITLSTNDISLIIKNGFKLGTNLENISNYILIMTGQPVIVSGELPKSPDAFFEKQIGNKIFLPIFDTKQVRECQKKNKNSTPHSIKASKNISYGTRGMALTLLGIKGPSLKKQDVSFSFKELCKVAGVDISSKKQYKPALKSLVNLGFEINEKHFSVPAYRYDISSQQDLNEEIFRFYGYDNFEPVAPIKIFSNNLESDILNIFKINIPTMGYKEVKTYTLISNKKNIINPFNFSKDIVLETYVSKERESIRNSMAHSLLSVIEYNQKRKIKNLSIWEKGMINDSHFVLALASTIKSFNEMKLDFINLFGDIFIFERAIDDNQFHTGITAMIKHKHTKDVIGWIGKIHPQLTKIDAFIAEIKLPLNLLKQNKKIHYSQEPMKVIDFTFELNLKESINLKIETIKSLGHFYKISIIDKFVKNDKKYITIRVVGDSNDVSKIDEKVLYEKNI